jgi:hypothetical protein
MRVYKTVHTNNFESTALGDMLRIIQRTLYPLYERTGVGYKPRIFHESFKKFLISSNVHRLLNIVRTYTMTFRVYRS